MSLFTYWAGGEFSPPAFFIINNECSLQLCHEDIIMKIVLIVQFFVMSAFLMVGCTSKKVQKAESVSLNQDTSKLPTPEKEAYPSEGQPVNKETFRYDASKVRDCILTMIKERGITTTHAEGQEDTVVTGFRFVTEDELKRIADPSTQTQAHWTKGMYNLRLTIEPGLEQSTTVTLVMRILGCGESSLPLLRPSPYQPLRSKGILEKELFSDILRCCQSENK